MSSRADIDKILGVDFSRTLGSCNLLFEKKVQRRKHKKKRINKKWAKRYGYKTVLQESKDWKIKPAGDDTFELIKEL